MPLVDSDMSNKVHIMQTERDPLNLRSLPPLSPPTDDWPVIEAALKLHHGRQLILRRTAGAMALAAAVILAIGLAVNLGQYSPSLTTDPEAGSLASGHTRPSNGTGSGSVESVIGLSQQLERNLKLIRSQVGTLPTTSLIYEVELEDLVAQVDEELSASPDAIDLWSQRVNLLIDLSQLYQNHLRREYQQIASI